MEEVALSNEDAQLGRAWRELYEAIPPSVEPVTTIAANAPGVWLVHTSFGMAEEDDFEVFAPSVYEGLIAVTRLVQEHRARHPDCPRHSN
jgi:hypothetical protein